MPGPATSRIDLRSSTPGVEFSVLDSRFVEVGAGVGDLRLEVPAGIYEVRERFGDRVETYLITVRPGEPFFRSSRHEIPTVAPALDGSTTSHEYQFEAAARASQSLARGDGPPSGVVLMSRTLRGHEAGVPGGIPPVSLRTLRGERVFDVDLGWQTERDYAVTSARLVPGVYVLRTDQPYAEPFEQAVVLCRGWQTLVFFPQDRRGPEPDRASVHMCSLTSSWEYGGRLHLVLEAALAGLAEGRLDISDADLGDLLYGKFLDPMLGIIGAHALLLSRNPRMDLYDHVLRNLHYLVPDHPDVAALSQLGSLAVPSEFFSAGEPPMLLPSYRRALLPANLTNPRAIVDGSPLERCAEALVERGVWFTWYAGALDPSDASPVTGAGPLPPASAPPAAPSAPPPASEPSLPPDFPEWHTDWQQAERSMGGLSEPAPPTGAIPLRKMQSYIDQVAAAEGWTRDEAARRVTPVGVAAACSLPVQVVRRLMPDVWG